MPRVDELPIPAQNEIKASRGAQATVQRNADGSSTVRSIEGQTHN